MHRTMLHIRRSLLIAAPLCATLGLVGLLASQPTVAHATYISTVLANPNLVATWRLGEAAGPTAAALPNPVNNGTYTNVLPGNFSQPGLISFDPNTAVNFNGSISNSYVDAGNNANLNGAWGGVTTVAWINLNSTSGISMIAGKWANTTGGDHFGLFQFNGKLIGAVSDGVTGGVNGYTGTATLTTGTKHFVAFTWTAGTGALNLYIDGAPDAISAPGTLITSINTSSTKSFFIGAQSPTVRQFDGIIDEVAVFSSALRAQQIADLYLAGISAPVPEPSTFALLGLGAIGLAIRTRRRAAA